MLTVLAVCVSYAATAWAQGGLVLELRVTRPSVVVGEPVYVILRMRNTGQTAQAVYPSVELTSGTVTVGIVDPTGDTRPFLPLGRGEPDAALAPLQPGEALAAMEPVFFGGLGWTFKKPGKYGLFAVYAHRADPELRSATASLEVLAGDGSGESLVVVNDIRGEEAGKFLVWFGGDHLRQGISRLEQIGSDNPQSPIGSYYYLAMASNWAAPFRDFVAGNVRAPRPTDALQYLTRVDINELPPGLVIRRYLVGARAAALTGNANESVQLLATAQAMANADPLLFELFNTAIQDVAAGQP